MSTKKSETRKFLEKITGGPVTLGKLIEAIRLGEEVSQAEFAKHLKISRSHLNDIEKGNKAVSPERAARFAMAGLAGAELPFLGFDAEEAEVELRRALSNPLRAVISLRANGDTGLAIAPLGH